MVTLGALWLPILLATLAVFFASALFWTALPHHRSDFKRLPDENGVLEVLRRQPTAPQQYSFPYAQGPKDLKNAEVRQKFEQGPVGMVTVMPTGVPSMGKSLIQTFAFYLAVSICVAYLTGRTLNPGEDYLAVFRVAGTVAFLAHGAAHLHHAIWMGVPWSNTWKNVADSVAYGLLTGGVFGAFWP